MTEFKSNPVEFRRRTIRRLLVELLVLAFAVTVAFLDVLPSVPRWMQWAVIFSVGAYILAGLAFYPRTKAIAQSFRVKLHDESLVFSHVHGSGEVRYSDLRVTKVKRRHGELVEIVILSKSGQVIRLSCLENMRELHGVLLARIPP